MSAIKKINRVKNAVKEGKFLFTKIDKKDQVLQNSYGLIRYLSGFKARLASVFGKDKLNLHKEVAFEMICDMDRFDFDTGAGTDHGIRITIPSGQNLGIKAGDELMIMSEASTLYKQKYKVVSGSNESDVAATATLNLTTDIVLTSVDAGADRNTNTFTIQVLAAAANPTNTILVAFSGTSAAIVCTVTPNDGTNNSATAVNLTTANLVQLINTGAVTGKNITLTDGSSFRTLQTATGGDATALADAGEGDGIAGTFSGGVSNSDNVAAGECRIISSSVLRLPDINPFSTESDNVIRIEIQTGERL
jgi:hypothetical protein